MATEKLDCCGLKCPLPTMQATVRANSLKPGDILEVVADCPTFEKDMRDWATRVKKTILWIREEPNNVKRLQVRI